MDAFLQKVANNLTPVDARSLSLTFWWAWVWIIFFPGDSDYMNVLDASNWWLVFLISASASAALLYCLSRREIGPLSTPVSFIACDLVLTVCTVSLFLVRGPLLMAVVCLSGFLSSVWAVQGLNGIKGFASRSRIVTMAQAMLFAAILYLLICGRPLVTEAVLCSFLPLFSVLSTLCSMKGDITRFNGVGEKESGFSPASSMPSPANAGIGFSAIIMFLCCTTFGAFGSTVAHGAEMGTGSPMMLGICCIGLGVVVLAAIVPHAISAQSFWGFTVPFYVTGLVVLISSTLFSFGSEQAAAFLVVMGWMCSVIFGWENFFPNATSPRTDRLWLSVLLLQAGALFGILLLVLTESLGMSKNQVPVVLMGLIAVLVLLLSFSAVRGFAFYELARGRMEDSAGAGVTDDGARGFVFSSVAAGLVEEFGLSEREGEILSALLKGHSLPRIANDLLISKSTVATHTQHIYKKLGLHSKQELIAFVERRCNVAEDAVTGSVENSGVH